MQQCSQISVVEGYILHSILVNRLGNYRGVNLEPVEGNRCVEKERKRKRQRAK